MIAAPLAPVEVAELVAERRDAEHRARQWLGIPSRLAHRQTDYWLGVAADVEDALLPDPVIRWRCAHEKNVDAEHVGTVQ